MTTTEQDLQAKRAIEDEFVKLGNERRTVEGMLGKNLAAIVDRIPEAIGAGISFDGVAKLVGYPRQTLYRWQAAKRIHTEHHAD